MDIRLQTGRLSPSLELIGCANMDGSTYGAFLAVRSGAFSSETEFYFSRDSLVSVFRGVNEMIKGHDIACRLGDGLDYIDWQCCSGSLVVSGRVEADAAKQPDHEFPQLSQNIEPLRQIFQFSFVVPGECLPKLLRDFSRLLDDISF
jgi:hypothetical protein